jgi:hypothetical protein
MCVVGRVGSSAKTFPQSCIRIDECAYPFLTHVEVSLTVLGINSAKWGELNKFKGIVVK